MAYFELTTYILNFLLLSRQGIIDIPGFAPNEITDILEDICAN